MKKNKIILFGALITAMMLGIAGCGSSAQKGDAIQTSGNEQNDNGQGTEQAGQTDAGEQKAALSPDEIYAKIKAAYTLPDMYEADADWLMNYYGIDAGMLSGYVFAEADEVHADRVIILNVADESNVAEVEGKLSAVLEQLSSPEMLDYLPDQADIITSASIKKDGNTLYLVISPDAEGIEEIIKKGLLGE
ncbi:DUF4358 domain-containing protein [Butyrivibrio sp. AE3004]|uniref:DUF4358 domain-containing protein n=1 Tax=Butyrivibrio sp. AE3004 TaxID=1506994 RepID=UPI0004948120|nr:DUF4358 domain-containing protein [Butyrivibrio sp. AE3004]